VDVNETVSRRSPDQIPVVSYLELGVRPHLVAHECAQCDALYFDRRNACAKCSGTTFGRKALSTEGIVTAFTIVHRAAKGQDAPYTSCIVELLGGGVVKGNLRGVAEPAQITPELKVRLVTFPVGRDDYGTTAVSFGFEPIGVAS
jgi:uncharacterized OB-fold protein